jgi:hypothetical protein
VLAETAPLEQLCIQAAHASFKLSNSTPGTSDQALFTHLLLVCRTTEAALLLDASGTGVAAGGSIGVVL